jgi:mono/diheme cytochrome c family protein
MKRPAAIVATIAIVLAVGLGLGAAADVPDSVKTIVQKNCAGCHKGRTPPKGLNLEPANLAAVIDAPSSGVPGAKIVDSETPEASYLLKKVRREKGIAGRPMPPGKALAAEELRALEEWIAGLK